jgi:hypothetical protein
MPDCPGCGNNIHDGERFCGQCGAAIEMGGAVVAKPVSVAGSVSKIELDPQLVNTLLAMYASKPDGPQIRLEGGRLKVSLGEHSVNVNPISLHEVAQVLLKAGPLGNLNLSVDLLHLGEQGLEVQLRLK